MTEGTGEHFQQPSPSKRDTPQSSIRGEGKTQRFSWTPQKVAEWFRLKKTSPPQQQEQSFDQLLLRARGGVEEFKRAYEAGDQEWKQFLTETEVGKHMQAMYLGVKPMFFSEDIDPRFLLKHLDPQFQIVRMSDVYDPDLVAEVLARHPDIFPVFSAKKHTIDTYVSRLLQKPPDSKKRIQYGLLLGYPRNAVLQYIKHVEILHMFFDPRVTSGQQLTPAEQAVRFHYQHGYKNFVEGASMDEFQTSVNQFRDEHAEEIQTVIEKVFRRRPLPQGAKNYLLTCRYIHLPGINYVSGNPNAEDTAFTQRVRTVFEQSGMNAYLASVKAP